MEDQGQKKNKNKFVLYYPIPYLCIVKSIDMVNSKVKIKGKKQTLTLTGESFIEKGITYYEVKERTCYIPENILIFQK